MKKLLVFSMVLVSFVSYGQNVSSSNYYRNGTQYAQHINDEVNHNNKITIGGMSGITFGGTLNANYGGWVDFGKFGIQYLYGARVSDESSSNYINGRTNSYTAGSTYNNIGAYGILPKFDNTEMNIIMGGGIQSSSDITTEGLKSQTSPLFIVGLQTDLGYMKQYTFRVDASLSQIMSINIGFGIKL